jgi:hypothetical protein
MEFKQLGVFGSGLLAEVGAFGNGLLAENCDVGVCNIGDVDVLWSLSMPDSDEGDSSLIFFIETYPVSNVLRFFAFTWPSCVRVCK